MEDEKKKKKSPKEAFSEGFEDATGEKGFMDRMSKAKDLLVGGMSSAADFLGMKKKEKK